MNNKTIDLHRQVSKLTIDAHKCKLAMLKVKELNEAHNSLNEYGLNVSDVTESIMESTGCELGHTEEWLSSTSADVALMMDLINDLKNKLAALEGVDSAPFS